MLIQESHVDVPTTADGPGTMRKYTALELSMTSGVPPTTGQTISKDRPGRTAIRISIPLINPILITF